MTRVGIYKIQSRAKPERTYIGSSGNIQKRWREHKNLLLNNKHENKRLQNHYNKYGKEDLRFSVLVECSPEKEILIAREQAFIDSCRPFFNICKRADRPPEYTHTEESRRKLSERMRGNKYQLGRKHSEETLKKMVESAKRTSAINHILNTVSCKGEDHPWYKKHHSDKTKSLLSQRTKDHFRNNPEARRSLSERMKKRWDDPAERANFIQKNSGKSHCWYGRKHTDEEKRKISESGKRAWVKRKTKKAA